MTQMHGKYLFTGTENVKGHFAFDIAPVHEIEHPFRVCNHALYVHVWPRKAIVLGLWRKNKKTVDDHLLEAMGGRVVQETTSVPYGIQSGQLQ